MSWHGQINRTIWEIGEQIEKHPEQPRFRRELLRAHFLQRFEYDKAHHVPRDDRTFLFLHKGATSTCLLLHGSQGTPAEMRELGNYLYQNGISAYCPRLARVDSKERMVTWESWVTQAETALDTVLTCCSNTFLVGLSLGGTIAMVLSSNRSLQGVVLLAPAIFLRLTLKTRMLRIARFLTPTLFYHLAGWNGEVLKAMDYARKNARRIRVPVLALQAEDDHRLSSRGIKFIRRHARLRRNDIHMLNEGGHVLTRGPAKEDVFTRVRDFVSRNSDREKSDQKNGAGAAAPAPDTSDPPELSDPRRDRSGRGRSGRSRPQRSSSEERKPQERRSDRDRRHSRRKRSSERRTPSPEQSSGD